MARSALITGASQGLGRTLATFLAHSGWDLILTARRPFDPAETLRLLSSAPGRILTVTGDIRDRSHRAELARIVESFQGLDLLVNNASSLGPSPLPSLARLDTTLLPEIFDINVFSPLALIQLTMPFLGARGGLIVNISSDAARGGYPGWGAYGASKAALDLISLTLAAELAGSGIGVVSVDPGDMRTQMQQDAFPGENIDDRPLPEVTIPFWAWLLGQDPSAVSGQRFQAQAEAWEIPILSS